MKFYKLDDEGNPTLCASLEEYAAWAGSRNRELDRVALDVLEGDIRISTVFLGMDHNYYGGPPLLYETMIFGGSHDEYQRRYSTRAEAVAGHKEALALAKEASK